MSRFNKKPSPLYREAVLALSRLIEAEGIDQTERASAEALSEPLLEQWKKTIGATRSQGQPCLNRLLGGRHQEHWNSDRVCHPCRIPISDHTTSWIKNGKPVCILSQPYSLSTENMREIVATCEEWDLSVTVRTGPGFHFPGRILSVLWKHKGRDDD